MKKWIITKIEINRIYWVGYNWFIDFKVWDNRYHCSNINNFMKAYNKDRRSNIESIKWSDFRVLSEYKKSDKWLLFEIELINRDFNPDKKITYIYWEK